MSQPSEKSDQKEPSEKSDQKEPSEKSDQKEPSEKSDQKEPSEKCEKVETKEARSTLENPLNPKLFELQMVFANRDESSPEMGWRVRDTEMGVLVEQVDEDSAAGRARVKPDDYILSACMRRTRTIGDLEKRLRDAPNPVRFMIARRRVEPLDTNKPPFPRVTENDPCWFRVVCRLDPSTLRRGSLRVGLLAGRLAILGADRKSAAAACGLRVGDRMLAVGHATPRDEEHFQRILNVIQGDPIDILVERRRRVPITVITTSGKIESEQLPCPSPVSSEEGDPSVGVPETPLELEQRLGILRPFLLKTTMAHAKDGGKRPVVGKTERRVTIKKPDDPKHPKK